MSQMNDVLESKLALTGQNETVNRLPFAVTTHPSCCARFFCNTLQYRLLPSWTYLPGLQFILAGLVGKTAAFFGVPAMRLTLDVLVYMGVIAVFVTKVVVLQDAGVITPWEFLWLGYLIGAISQQVIGGCVSHAGREVRMEHARYIAEGGKKNLLKEQIMKILNT